MSQNLIRIFFGLLWMLLAAASSAAQPSGYNVGVYYFPGWKYGAEGNPSYAVDPWAPIKAFPEREPLLGWYQDGDKSVMEQQLKWMLDYGIDYVVFDWYWTANNKALLTHSIDAYKSIRNAKPRFSIMWANHNNTPNSLANYDSMVSYWIENYFKDGRYWKIGHKPVVYIFSVHDLDKKASALGVTSAWLLERANTVAKNYGFDGLYFVGGVGLERQIVREGADAYGYDAFSAYNYHVGLELGSSSLKPLSSSYYELDQGYQFVWDWMVKYARRPYFVPVTSGWNKTPWGGSSSLLHDNSESTVDSFRSHLISAKSYLDRYPDKTKSTVVICCWNEFGEGSYIEPTKKMGFRYLDVVKQVFGK